ncbi:MAG: hypothetical protein ACREKM_10670 [Longimicrobiales bacterium]
MWRAEEMEFDEMVEAWRRQPTPATDPAQELRAVRARAADLARTVRRRDWIETGIALVLLPLFAWQAARGPTLLASIGAAIIAVACILIPLRLRHARGRSPDPTLPVLDALRAELQRVRAQERLLGTVAWWYFGPLGIGVILFVGGSSASAAFRIGYAVVVVLLYGGLLHLNLRAVRDIYGPLARELETWIADIEGDTDGNSFDGVSREH